MKGFLIVFAGDIAGSHISLIAGLADSADGFQIEGIFIRFLIGRREDDADIANFDGCRCIRLSRGLQFQCNSQHLRQLFATRGSSPQNTLTSLRT